MYRYGFHHKHDEEEDGILIDDSDPVVINAVEGLKHVYAAGGEDLDPKYYHRFITFTQNIKSGRPLRDLWDLSFSNPAHLPVRLSLLSKNVSLTVIITHTHSGMLYWIQSCKDTYCQDGFYLAVEQATIAIEVL